MQNIIDYDFFRKIEKAAFEVFESLSEEELNEGSRSGSVDTVSSAAHSALKKKSEKSGFPLGILKQVFKRGKAAWKKSHYAGTTPDQWAHARVNSFITGGKTTKMHDKKLYQQAKKNRKKRK